MDIDSLPHGPEYTYRVEITTINKDGLAGARTRFFNVDSALKCRPRDPDTLNCRFEATNMAVSEDGLLRLAQETVEDLWIGEEPFEIRFQKNGIVDLLVSRNMQPWTVDMIRAIVNQLNIGVDLRGKSDGVYDVMERSFLGECRTMIDLSHRVSEDSWKDDKFEILPLAGLRKEPGEILRIEKTRDLNDCTRKEDYFLASMSNHPLHRPGAATIKSSQSRIIVSDANYTSFTVNVAYIVDDEDRTRNFLLLDKISLSLETISAAKTELPKVPDAISVSFFARDHIEGNGVNSGDESFEGSGEGNDSTRVGNQDR